MYFKKIVFILFIISLVSFGSCKDEEVEPDPDPACRGPAGDQQKGQCGESERSQDARAEDRDRGQGER